MPTTNRMLIVFYEGSPLVGTVQPFDRMVDLNTFLNWYASSYAFDRMKLTAGIVNMIELPTAEKLHEHYKKINNIQE